MPSGKHKGTRVALSVPPGIYNQIDQWAEAEGRPVASLCMSLIEQAVRKAVADGICPSVEQTKENDPYLNTKPGVTAVRLPEAEAKEVMRRAENNKDKTFTQQMMDKLAESVVVGKANKKEVDVDSMTDEQRQELATKLLAVMGQSGED